MTLLQFAFGRHSLLRRFWSELGSLYPSSSINSENQATDSLPITSQRLESVNSDSSSRQRALFVVATSKSLSDLGNTTGITLLDSRAHSFAHSPDSRHSSKSQVGFGI
ncbi:unnamed protein product [Protopolystoma xenopodis]|uniref:Uncharacterized protein n=1 Tax=Protopolystoma xenopodis TaxID=117903 RepID=A0A3S5CQA2_9PLAT|nr:unnamed protein product [Protopolystoma xenopodis]